MRELTMQEVEQVSGGFWEPSEEVKSLAGVVGEWLGAASSTLEHISTYG